MPSNPFDSPPSGGMPSNPFDSPASSNHDESEEPFAETLGSKNDSVPPGIFGEELHSLLSSDTRVGHGTGELIHHVSCVRLF